MEIIFQGIRITQEDVEKWFMGLTKEEQEYITK
jgi:hypothetical protein